MHKPDPKKSATAQDKRSVIPIELNDVDWWLTGSVEEASSLLRLAPEDILDTKPIEVPSLGGANVITQQALW